MAKVKRKTKKVSQQESDSAYFLKMVLYLIIGSQWIWLVDPGLNKQIPIPAGFIVGMLFAWHEHFRVDRKIEFAILLISTLIGFWAQVGVYAYVL